jgi:hypothetical protein
MAIEQLTDKEYHNFLRQYKQYVILCVEEDKRSENKTIPLSIEAYYDSLQNKKK